MNGVLNGEIVGVLLAAGRGRRFGSDKRWHPLADGTPMALASAQRLLAACPHVIAVLRPEDDALAAALGRLGVTVAPCAEADEGMGRSLAAGIGAASQAAGWLVALADMPAIAPSTYQLVRQALQEGASLARPLHEGQAGHPVGFSGAHREALLALRGDAGGRQIIATHRAALRLCEVDDPGVLLDIDLPPAVSG